MNTSRFSALAHLGCAAAGRALLALLAVLTPAAAQTGPSNSMAREAMWPAPSAEDWQRPCLITWQRTWEDALAVSRETGKPLMACVNMDGEIASEHYAGIRYRQPEIASLYEPYVTVIASVYRHTPSDHDESGRRILCPRFGSVTCGEHIAIEPGLYERYFEGQRVAPRHIGVELDSEEMYDVFYAFDTDSVFATIRDGITNRPEQPEPEPRGDMTLVERVASPDESDRNAVELAYLDGDRAMRKALLDAAIAAGDAVPIELLRLAMLGYDAELGRLARVALQQSSSPQAIDLIVEALLAPLSAAERSGLIHSLERLGENSARARRLAVVHQGLATTSSAVDANAWATHLELAAAEYTSNVPSDDPFEAHLERQDDVLESGDAAAHLDLAEAFLAQAYEQPDHEQENRQMLLLDARDTAARALQLGSTGWRVDAVLAIASYYLDDKQQAWPRADAAVAAGVPDDAADWNSMAVLAIFAQGRQEAIRKALREKVEWPGQWLADVHAACSVLARHPYGTDTQIEAHYDFLDSLGADRQAEQILQAGLDRFPDSPALHERLRGRILSRRGVAQLEAEYEDRLNRGDDGESLSWYAGFASAVAAEFHRRAGRDNEAFAAYARAIAHYERDIEQHESARLAADTEIAMALAGRARVALQQGDVEQSLSLVLSSFARQPDAAANLDGLNLSPVDTAKMLRALLASGQRGDLLQVLETALAHLDPRLLRLPSYERAVQRPDRRRPSRRGSGPGSGARAPTDAVNPDS
jgi:hypothetical protein